MSASYYECKLNHGELSRVKNRVIISLCADEDSRILVDSRTIAAMIVEIERLESKCDTLGAIISRVHRAVEGKY